MNEKIDFVITWVDGNDPKWLKERFKYENNMTDVNPEVFKKWINAKSRYRDWDNLKYWFRSVETNANWVNKIYFITWGHVPEWLDTNNPKIKIINHKDFIPKKYLPTFNSKVIELNIHRIKDLSENFVLFNDDVFINAKLKEDDFFKNGLPCELAAFDVVDTDYYITNSDINNMKVLNKYFNKKQVLKNRKWYKLRYGKHLIKTLVLKMWDKITGLVDLHICCSYKKSSFEWLWKNEPYICNETCMCKFRNKNNINHWVVKGYQLLSGNFYPRSATFGISYGKKIDNEIIRDIEKSVHKVICINDFECTDEEFLKQRNLLNSVFEKKYPNKSSFEK